MTNTLQLQLPTGTWELDASATFAASARVDRADLGVDKLPSLIIGPMLDLTVSATASRTD